MAGRAGSGKSSAVGVAAGARTAPSRGMTGGNRHHAPWTFLQSNAVHGRIRSASNDVGRANFWSRDGQERPGILVRFVRHAVSIAQRCGLAPVGRREVVGDVLPIIPSP